MANITELFIVLGLFVVLLVPILWLARESYRLHRRETVEDALKALIGMEGQHVPNVADMLAGRLHISRQSILLVHH